MCAMGPEAMLVRGRMTRPDDLRAYAELEHVREFDLYVGACRETAHRGMALLAWIPRVGRSRARAGGRPLSEPGTARIAKPLAALPIGRPEARAATEPEGAPRPIAFLPTYRDAPR